MQRLLKLMCEDKVGEFAITYEDRLTRFGPEYVETLFACFDVTLTVLEPGEEKTPEQELTDDLLALIASFSGRFYEMRSHKQKELLLGAGFGCRGGTLSVPVSRRCRGLVPGPVSRKTTSILLCPSARLNRHAIRESLPSYLDPGEVTQRQTDPGDQLPSHNGGIEDHIPYCRCGWLAHEGAE